MTPPNPKRFAHLGLIRMDRRHWALRREQRKLQESVYDLWANAAEDLDSQKALIAAALDVVHWCGTVLPHEDRVTLSAEVYGVADDLAAPMQKDEA